MPRLSELLDEAVPVKFTHRGREYNLEAYPERCTNKLRAEGAAKDATDVGAGDAHTICTLVKSWDITGDDEKPLPLDRNGIDQLSNGLKSAIILAVAQESVNPTSAASAANSQST